MAEQDELGGPRWLYLHGFGSGPSSSKGVALARHLEPAGIHLERLNGRLPSLEHLRPSKILEMLARAIGGERDRAIVFGSSLGGYCASRLAERDPRVSALVLLAPAFGLLARWRARLGGAAITDWEKNDALEIDDYAEKKRTTVDFGFVRDLEQIDREAGSPYPVVNVPTLIVHGVRDDVVTIESSRVFATGKRHVRLVEVDDGHELVASLPRICDEVDAFFPWAVR